MRDLFDGNLAYAAKFSILAAIVFGCVFVLILIALTIGLPAFMKALGLELTT